jgi:hypothetical protein
MKLEVWNIFWSLKIFIIHKILVAFVPLLWFLALLFFLIYLSCFFLWIHIWNCHRQLIWQSNGTSNRFNFTWITLRWNNLTVGNRYRQMTKPNSKIKKLGLCLPIFFSIYYSITTSFLGCWCTKTSLDLFEGKWPFCHCTLFFLWFFPLYIFFYRFYPFRYASVKEMRHPVQFY